MAITLDQLEQRIIEAFGNDFRYQKVPEENFIATGSGTKSYKDKDGENFLRIIIRLSENGEYIDFFSPAAFNIANKNKLVFLEACCMVQWMTKLIQFEYDHKDGEIRPIIEFPLVDNTVTAKQIHRALSGLVSLMDTYYNFLVKAGDGKIDLNIIKQSQDAENMEALRRMAAQMGIDVSQLADSGGTGSGSDVDMI